MTPIFATSTYKQDGVGGLRAGYEYSRTANPTRRALEDCLAALEGGACGLAFASGMAAEDALLRVVCRPGDHVVIPGDAYGGTYRLFKQVFEPWGLEHTSADITRHRRDRGRHRHRKDQDRLDRDAQQPPDGDCRPRRRLPRWRTMLVRSCSSTTPSRRRTSSSRWRLGRTSSCTRPPSTAEATATSSAGALVTADADLGAPARHLRELDRRRPRAVRLLSDDPWVEDARGADGTALRQRRGHRRLPERAFGGV